MPDTQPITTNLPGLVIRLLVDDGERVREGQGILITETMKCEQTLVAPVDGTVAFSSTIGDVVEPGHVVAKVTPVRASKPATVNTRGPRPLSPQSVVDLVCGPNADPRLGPAARSGTFVEYDLVETPPMFANPSPGDRLVRVEPGHERECGVMIGVMTHVVDGHPEGISRVWIGGDPSRSMGAVAEAECRRIIAAIDLAERLDVPVEWVAISAGARIAWDSGTENMDWCAAVVARLITFTQRGGQVVVVVSGINVGAQSYWNAEATMLGHHKGMLIMLPDQAMVLTGKRALALSGGGTHATDAHIGGYDEVMGPNGQAHHKAATMIDAYRMVFSHHSLCSRRRDDGCPRGRLQRPAGPRHHPGPLHRARAVRDRRRGARQEHPPGPQAGLRHAQRDGCCRRPRRPCPRALDRHGRRARHDRLGQPHRWLPGLRRSASRPARSSPTPATTGSPPPRCTPRVRARWPRRSTPRRATARSSYSPRSPASTAAPAR